MITLKMLVIVNFITKSSGPEHRQYEFYSTLKWISEYLLYAALSWGGILNEALIRICQKLEEQIQLYPHGPKFYLG